MGSPDYGLMGPGSQYQIDATVGDIYLVSQFDRSNIIGRPVMYFVLDAFSRMVTGMYVGLEGPSWVGAMMAIANAASDKTAYCREYGIRITEEEWPCHHIPAAILGDRGEMESRNADNLVSMLGIRIENIPPYRAAPERHHRTALPDNQYQCHHYAAGTGKAGYGRKGREGLPAQTAKLTFASLQRLSSNVCFITITAIIWIRLKKAGR